ncbi:MAG: hypothetical protein WDO19_33120 [Bacteroidota bacterium]
MKYKIIVAVVSLLITCSLPAQKNNKPASIIYLIVIWARIMMMRGPLPSFMHFADKGEAKILATIASTKYEGVAAVLDVFNTFFNRSDIPIAVPKGKALELKDWQHWTDTLIANYPHTIKNNDEVPDAIDLYRNVLSAQPDKSVTIVTVGFLTNLSNLLQSNPDKYSSLNGKELVQKKVKQLVCMAARFPAGKEFKC